MRAVYVIQDGATLRRDGERLLVTAKREHKQAFAVTGLQQLVLMGNVTLTAGAIDLVVSRGVDTVILGHHGRYRGRVTGSISGNVVLRLAQYRVLTDADRARDLAVRIVAGKLKNQRAFLLRHTRAHGMQPRIRDAERSIRAVRARLELAATLDQVRGCEGAGSAAYFRAFGALLRAPGLRFDGRNRRPPIDPVNALLSFGYTLLSNVVEASAEVVGLDPYLGALHTPLAGRPSLVCDLVEEHRVPVVDALVVAAINRGVFKPEHFGETGPDEPVILKRETIRWLVTLFERRLERRQRYGPQQQQLPYRHILEQQCRRLARSFLHGEAYEPVELP